MACDVLTKSKGGYWAALYCRDISGNFYASTAAQVKEFTAADNGGVTVEMALTFVGTAAVDVVANNDVINAMLCATSLHLAVP